MTETNTRESGGASSEPAPPAPEPQPEKPEDPSPADKGSNGGGAAALGPESHKPESPRLVARGNPLRLARGGLTTLLGSVIATALMGHPGQLRWGVPLGALFVAIASWGVMDLLGTFDDADDRVVASTTLGALTRPLVAFVAAGLLFCMALGLAAAGVAFPQPVWGILVALA